MSCGEPDAQEWASPVRWAGRGNGPAVTPAPRPVPTQLPESQSPDDAKERPSERRLLPTPRCATASYSVTKTHSRPYTSSDNPYPEAQFKTLKYRPEFPDRFDSIEQAREHCRAFFD